LPCARHCSDNQRDASIEDQLRVCREKAEREKWTTVSTYKDAGISGAGMILRPGIQTLLRDAQRRQFDVKAAGKTRKRETPAAFATGVSVSVVAGIGFEPMTFRL
jgi:hypothetical protein